ncbi:MAG: MCE family protein [Rhodospirillaceae bacterium]|jgi:phospholipid/cholesterol/gamma-HCH transport system substrate-binding protein|nr:MCE family protein [Rhodospirillaceae bacterium]
METRANHLLVGSFVLAVLAGLVVFVVWLTKVQIDQEYAYYRILFSGSVTGLKVGNAVRYRGIPVGSVDSIRIDPDNVEQIEVVIEVPRNTPVKTDTEASLEMQGITGVAYVQLSGGSQASPVLKSGGRKDMPTLPSKPSELAQVIEGAPELINRFIELVDRASNLLSETNQAAIAGTLANLNQVSGAVAGRSDEIERILVDTDATVAEMRGAVTAFRRLTEGLNDEIDETMHAAQGTAESLTGLSNEITAMVAENRRPIQDFTSVGLYELSLLVNELRTLTGSLTRLTDKVENDPARFFFGDDISQGVDLR